MEPEYGGSQPSDVNFTPANITWIIRWKDRAQRDRHMKQLPSDPKWQEIFAQVPGGRKSYFKTEAKFATEID
ncbi:hypothetical protein ACFL7M_04505 [Thermodesulfobacteriota bacterium]